MLILPLGSTQLILCDILSFHGFDKLFANAHNIGRKVRPLDLRVVQGLFGILLLPLVSHQSLLHLGQSVTHFIILRRNRGARDRESIGLRLAEHEEKTTRLLGQMGQTQLECPIVDKAFEPLFHAIDPLHGVKALETGMIHRISNVRQSIESQKLRGL